MGKTRKNKKLKKITQSGGGFFNKMLNTIRGAFEGGARGFLKDADEDDKILSAAEVRQTVNDTQNYRLSQQGGRKRRKTKKKKKKTKKKIKLLS